VGPLRAEYRGVGTFRNSTCGKSRAFVYYEPAGPGPAPIAVYLPGTVTRHDDPLFLMYLQRLAARGYVAASVDYGQFAVLCSFGCRCYKPRADCLFDPEGPGSLVSVLAARTRGDPSLGIVVWGHSQGGYMALMAGDLNPDVRRVVATGATDCGGYYDCIGPGARGLPSDRIRVVIGEHDRTAPPHQAADRDTTPGFLRQLAGLTEQPEACRAPGNRSCFRPNGSGFYIVRDEETAEGVGDHRFWQNSEGARGNRVDSLDTVYLGAPEKPWSLDATIDWLAGACGNGTCDRTEDPRTCALDCARPAASPSAASR
jgi:pimeloyl-ACP methyl ester carboxylesterase